MTTPAEIALKAAEWRPISEAPTGLPSDSVGCRNASEWFWALRKDGREMRVCRRAWPQEDGFADEEETYYTAEWFTHFKPLGPGPEGEG